MADITDAQRVAAALAAPFDPADLEWRVGSTNKDKTKGQALCYVNARAVMDRLDAVLGIDGWHDEYSTSAGPKAGVECRLSLRIDGKWITKADSADQPDTEPVKGGYSDALKRAAVRFGVGRYLYDLPKVWAPLTDGKYLPKDFSPQLPASALPKPPPPAEKGKVSPPDAGVYGSIPAATGNPKRAAPAKNGKSTNTKDEVATQVTAALENTGSYAETVGLPRPEGQVEPPQFVPEVPTFKERFYENLKALGTDTSDGSAVRAAMSAYLKKPVGSPKTLTDEEWKLMIERSRDALIANAQIKPAAPPSEPDEEAPDNDPFEDK